MSSPFLNPDPERVFYQSPLVIGLWDAFPVSPGHALIVPRRVVATWFEASREEQVAILDGIEAAKVAIEERVRPDGYNIGLNAGAAAGQTVFHLHVHVIPRFEGDVPDPRGGVRHVIPAKANYLVEPLAERVREAWRPSSGRLISHRLLPELVHDLDQAQEVQFAVAFLMRSGYRLIADRLHDLLVQRQGRATILTGDYLDVTDPEALQSLLDLSVEPAVENRLQLFVFGAQQAQISFHPKSYLFVSRQGQAAAYVGSSNLSESALTSGIEWNYRVSQATAEVQENFRKLLFHPATQRLTQQWLDQYRARRQKPSGIPVVEAPAAPPRPHRVQEEALQALEQTRAEGNQAGLVVLATGVGKTWLAAFDSQPFHRVLFVAHRDEILQQAFRTFRALRPTARLGFFTGKEKNPNKDVLFASVATLTRHYLEFHPSSFDYIVMDEFHHACASSYRRLLDYFAPQFLLAITATPERSDGGDLLSLCNGNVVYRCDLAQAIERELLVPIRYHGVPDTVDYAQIPWRKDQFDPHSLEHALATETRAQNCWEQFSALAGQRTVAFCCSQRHADYMANFFQSKGARAVAVYAGPDSAPRSESLQLLADGELDILFSVDIFNEGTDLPQVDTVMMLRPTNSRVLWLQQLGRGLRKATEKTHLTVIDYIGNHRIFLQKLRLVFSELAACSKLRDSDLKSLLQRLQKGNLELAPGCHVTYQLQAIDIIEQLLRRSREQSQVCLDWINDFVAEHGRRPTASQAYYAGFNPRAVSKEAGWFGLLAQHQLLGDREQAALEENAPFLDYLASTRMSKAYKMSLLEAYFALQGVDDSSDGTALAKPTPIAELTEAFVQQTRRSALLCKDVSIDLNRLSEVRALLENQPIDAFCKGEGSKFFRYIDGLFACSVHTRQREVLLDMAREIVRWRLDEYLQRASRPLTDFEAKVSQSQGRPLLFLDRKAFPQTPQGECNVLADGKSLLAFFVKVALNKVVEPGSTQNLLPEILRGWFGPNAGQPGTSHRVRFTLQDGTWTMSPVRAPDNDES